MTVLTDALAYPNIERIFLAEITAGQHLTFWTLNSGSTYYAAAIYKVTGVKENGVSLTEQSSIANVDANPGSFYYDAVADRVYVQTTTSATPYNFTLQAVLQFYFSNRGKIFNGNYYEPLLSSAPNLSLRVQRRFTGIGQIGGGNIALVNADGFFDAMTDLQWDAGKATVKFGVDRPGQTPMAYADYETVGAWLTRSWRKKDNTFNLSVAEDKIEIKKKIPYTFYDRATYANIREDDVGKAIQIAYGVIKDAEPVLIDTTTNKLKVAGHAIISFDGLRVKSATTDAWETKTFATTDIANGEFTISTGDWTDGQDIAVDFTGKPKTGTVVMDNASDIVKDILETYLSTPAAKIDAASFTESYNRLDTGQVFESSDRRTRGRLGVYINAPETVETTISAINMAVGSYLFAGPSGKFFYKVFEPIPGEGLTEFTTEEITSFSELTSNNEVISKVNVHYNRRHVRDWSESAVFEVKERQYNHNQNAPVLRDIEVLLTDTGDANQFAQTQINYEGRPERAYQITVPARIALTLTPGDFVRVIYARHGVDNAFEVLGVNHNLLADTTSLTLGDMHGIGDRSGFLIADAAVLPSRFSGLAGYGAGSLVWNSGWDDQIKEWARQNVGHWADDNGFAAPADADSFISSSWV